MADYAPNDPATPSAPSGMAARIRNILLHPAEEWRAIDAEPMTVSGIFRGWVLPLAAIGPVASLIGGLLFGHGDSSLVIPPSAGALIGNALLTYALSVAGVWIIAQIINALAPSFGGTRDAVQATKVAAFASTANWLAGIFLLVPQIAFLQLLGLYSLYLLWIGLPMLMKPAADKAVGYTVVTIVVTFVVFMILGALIGILAAALTPQPTGAGFVPPQ